jgi:hypothetical protein
MAAVATSEGSVPDTVPSEVAVENRVEQFVDPKLPDSLQAARILARELIALRGTCPEPPIGVVNADPVVGKIRRIKKGIGYASLRQKCVARRNIRSIGGKTGHRIGRGNRCHLVHNDCHCSSIIFCCGA